MISFQDEAQRRRFANTLRDPCRLIEEKKATICALAYTPFAYNTESVANFSRVSLLKRPKILNLSRTATDLETKVVSSIPPHLHLIEFEDGIGAMKGNHTQASPEKETVAEDQDFSSHLGNIEISVIKPNVPKDDSKEGNFEDDEKITVLELVPRELEALEVARPQ